MGCFKGVTENQIKALGFYSRCRHHLKSNNVDFYTSDGSLNDFCCEAPQGVLVSRSYCLWSLASKQNASLAEYGHNAFLEPACNISKFYGMLACSCGAITFTVALAKTGSKIDIFYICSPNVANTTPRDFFIEVIYTVVKISCN